MDKNKTKGFTLVELIVVITILAILGTIAFISLQGYSKSARDSTRISDISNVRKALELGFIQTSRYPSADDSGEVTYSGTILWKQGFLGESVVNQIGRISKLPLDPLFDTRYVYSTTSNNKDYQISFVTEDENISHTPAINQVGANSLNINVVGSYNEVYLKTGNYIIPTPSIITSASLPIELTGLNINSQVVHGGENIPDIGTLGIEKQEGMLDIENFQVHEGEINKKSSQNDILSVYNVLAETYSGSTLERYPIIRGLLEQQDEESKGEYTKLLLFDTSHLQDKYISKNQEDTPVANETCSVGGVIPCLAE